MDVKQFIQQHEVDLIITTVNLEQLSVPHIVISPLLGPEDKKKLETWLNVTGQHSAPYKHNNSALLSLIKNGFLFSNVKRTHRYEVVEMLANSLYKQGSVEHAFIHNTLMRERESATGIGGGIAIPHGKPDLVKSSSIAMAVLPEAIEWGDELVKVAFLIALAPEDKQVAKDVIEHLSTISKDPSKTSALSQVSTFEDLESLL
nr:PTS sugar transporter subunit IIA [Lentibacillus sp. JNUCC-1]